MARKQTDKAESVTFSVEIPVTKEHLSELMDQCADKNLNESQTVASMAYTSLTELAKGGLLISADEMTRIEAATGLSPTCGEDLIPYLSEASGREEGKLKVSVLIDPAYEEAYQEIARMQERPVEELFQEGMDAVLANEWTYELSPERRPIHVLMPPNVHAELEEILGGKFTTGMDLAKLVKQAVGQSEALAFEDLSNVGQGAIA